MKKYFTLFLVLSSTFFIFSVEAEEKWSDVSYEIRSIFPQAKRENPNHVHSELILFALKEMNVDWLPGSGEGACSPDYFYIEKTDTHLYSLLLAVQVSGNKIRVAVTNVDRKNDICRATMIASPSY